jgi:hypothetical protein
LNRIDLFFQKPRCNPSKISCFVTSDIAYDLKLSLIAT